MFPSKRADSGHLPTVAEQFRAARRLAGLPEPRKLYGARHAFGTYAVEVTGRRGAAGGNADAIGDLYPHGYERLHDGHRERFAEGEQGGGTYLPQGGTVLATGTQILSRNLDVEGHTGVYNGRYERFADGEQGRADHHLGNSGGDRLRDGGTTLRVAWPIPPKLTRGKHRCSDKSLDQSPSEEESR